MKYSGLWTPRTSRGALRCLVLRCGALRFLALQCLALRFGQTLGLMLIANLAHASIATGESAITRADWMRVLGSLLLVIVIMGVVVWVLKKIKWRPMGAALGFQMVASYPLGLKEKVVLLNAGGRYLLLGVTSASINLLHDYGDTCPSDFNISDGSSFKATLKKALGKKKNEA